MGKGEIISDYGNGRYLVKLSHNLLLAQSFLSAYQKRKADLEAANTSKDPDSAEYKINLLQIIALDKKIIFLQEVIATDYTVSAWCADKTEGLTGVVGTIEIAHEIEKGFNVQPGYDGNAAYASERDGLHMPFSVMPVASAMLNFAIMPGVQKWRPTYRYGTIITIDYQNHVCSLTINREYSHIQGLGLDFNETFENVPIEYMSCDSAAFEVGDEVILKWDPYDTENGNTKVIGFRSEPQPCASGYCAIISAGGLAVVWDVMNNQVFVLPGITYPASYTDVVNALTAQGWAIQSYSHTLRDAPALDPDNYCVETVGTRACGETKWDPELAQILEFTLDDSYYFNHQVTGGGLAFVDLIHPEGFYWNTENSNGKFIRTGPTTGTGYQRTLMGDKYKSQYIWEEIQVSYRYEPSNIGSFEAPILREDQYWEWTCSMYIKPLLSGDKIHLATLEKSRHQWRYQSADPSGWTGGESGDERSVCVNQIWSSYRCSAYKSNPEKYLYGDTLADYKISIEPKSNTRQRFDVFRNRNIALAAHSFAIPVNAVYNSQFRIKIQKNAEQEDPGDPDSDYIYDWDQFTELNHGAILSYFSNTNQLFQTRLAIAPEQQ